MEDSKQVAQLKKRIDDQDKQISEIIILMYQLCDMDSGYNKKRLQDIIERYLK